MAFYARESMISRMVRTLMRHGKKETSQRIVDGAFAILKREHDVSDPIKFLYEAVQNAKPLIETRSIIVAGRKVLIPKPVPPHRQEGLALRFVRDAMRERKEHTAESRLAKELLELHEKQGGARRRRDNEHRTAEANRAYVR
mmetsp:Transcript_15525/g.41744  ORF Transcript_15525/g.41744 Transcript_15525/m.41744 type:complete len:142 (-) Transcript_15525:325-750(-)